MGIYQSPIGLSYSNDGKRTRNTNIFPIVLRPYTANFDAVINAINYLIPLEKGVIMEIHGKLIIVLVFTIYYTGDMPQQDKNSGIAGLNSLKFCRFYYISLKYIINKQDAIYEISREMNRFYY